MKKEDIKEMKESGMKSNKGGKKMDKMMHKSKMKALKNCCK